MILHELDIGWAETENERRYLHWELLASDAVRGVFQTGRERTLAVLYDGDRFEPESDQAGPDGWDDQFRNAAREGC